MESAAEAAVAQAGGDSKGISAESVLHLTEAGARTTALSRMEVLRDQISDTDAMAAGAYATAQLLVPTRCLCPLDTVSGLTSERSSSTNQNVPFQSGINESHLASIAQLWQLKRGRG